MTLSSERAGELTKRLWATMQSDDTQGAAADLIREVGPAEMCELYTLWVGTAVGMYNIIAPIESGYHMKPGQLEGTKALLNRMSHGRGEEIGVAALGRAFMYVSEAEFEAIGTEFAQVWAQDERGAADMLVLAALMLRTAATMHGVPLPQMAVRAAQLRSLLVDVRTAVKEADWCSHCLPIAADIAEKADDRVNKHPMESVPEMKDDLSFLDGINLGGTEGGDKEGPAESDS